MGTGTSSGGSKGEETLVDLSPLPYGAGAVAGVCAVLFGYLVTVLLTATRALDAIGGAAPTGGLAGLTGWKAVGWLFYGAHGVAVRFSTTAGVTSVDFVGTSGGSLVFLYVVPPATLLLAGGLTAARAGARRPKRAAASGATVVVGYAVALLAGSVLLGATFDGATATPGLPLFPAVGYPLVFGAMGGVAAAALSTPSAAERANGTSESSDG
jgi:hypothetical protein